MDFVCVALIGLLIGVFLLWLQYEPIAPSNHEDAIRRISKFDEEYLNRMPGHISPDIALKVRRILVDVSGCDDDEVWPATHLSDLLE
ncbi:MAG: hypothetical protein AB8B55_11125 [Mariniblastus sp.]